MRSMAGQHKVKNRTTATIAVAALVAVTAVGVGIALSGSSAPRPSAQPTFIHGAFPASINTSCTADDTRALGEFFYGLHLSASGRTTVVNFGKDCLQVDGTLFLRGLENLSIEGGTWEEAQAHDVASGDWTGVGPRRPAYCGSSKYPADVQDTYTLDRFTLMWAFEGGCDITMKDMTITGPNTAASSGHLELEQDTFVTFYGTQRALVDNVTMRNPYGDYLDASFLHEVPGGLEYLFPATDITVENCRLSGSGRQGLSVILGRRIAFDHNTILGADATVFDIEADAIGGYETDISITDNTVVGFHYAYLLSAQTGASIDRLAFTGNRMTDGAQMRVVIVDRLAGSNVRISHNSATAADTASDYKQPAIRISGISDVEVDDNIIPVARGGLAVLPPGALLCNEDACPIHSPVASPIAPELPS